MCSMRSRDTKLHREEKEEEEEEKEKETVTRGLDCELWTAVAEAPSLMLKEHGRIHCYGTTLIWYRIAMVSRSRKRKKKTVQGQ